jgi:hypothetical protein
MVGNMRSLDMGPTTYNLTIEKIDEVVTKTSPGNYALGYISDKKFILKYVGRSDDDVNARLKQWAGKSSKYKNFKFSYASSKKEAFEKDCKNYHDFGESEELYLNLHPDRPDGTDYKCPRCDHYG